MANILKTLAIVLKTMRFKESSLIASLLTQKFGKIKILAKGIKRPKSKFCGALEPFILTEIIFYKREFKELYTVSSMEIVDYFDSIRIGPKKVNAALVLCEFFDKTLPPEECDNSAFILLLSFLKKLQQEDELNVCSLLYCFLLRALSGAGITPHLKDCVRCHQPINFDGDKIDFSIGAGGVVCDMHFDDTTISISRETLGSLGQIYNNRGVQFSRNSLAEIEDFIPDYLVYHLNGLVLNSLRQLR